MGVRFDDSGFRKIEKRLRETPEHQEMEFSPEFMRKWTDYDSMDALIEASSFSAEQVRVFLDAPSAAWDAFIQNHTRFGSWRAFVKQLTVEHVRKQLPEFQ